MNYHLILSYEKDIILKAVKKFDPVTFRKLNIFLVDNNQDTNKFWELNYYAVS